MPSNAYQEFSKNLTDVKRIISLHNELSRPEGQGKRGKRALGHLTRGGTVLLCAAWERYIESVLEEGATFLAQRHSLTTLHAQPKKFVTDFVNGKKSTFTQSNLPDNLGAALVEAVRTRTEKFNTPKYENIQPLFQQVLALDDIADAWSLPSATIDEFVKRRGEVAHRGGQSKYVRFSDLVAAVDTVSQFVLDTDNCLSDHVRTLVSPHQRPWYRK
jgi:hypothetical protein